ncbi:MAG TPA: divalent-cation tolerance protein CutA [Candidatus Saccharimonadales bacterium]|nr:divalent-cation tolerance protein CutA [Candidatus Saccharimonadales bacterium]
MANFVELVLTCASWQEAQKIVDHLLEQRLIACAKFLPIEAKYWWEGELESAKEIMLLMESVQDNFKKVEAEVAKLHSYKTFVLQALPVTEVSAEATAWLQDNLQAN